MPRACSKFLHLLLGGKGISAVVIAGTLCLARFLPGFLFMSSCSAAYTAVLSDDCLGRHVFCTYILFERFLVTHAHACRNEHGFESKPEYLLYFLDVSVFLTATGDICESSSTALDLLLLSYHCIG